MTQSEMLPLLQQLKQAYVGQESPDERYKFASAAIDDAISMLESGKVSIEQVQNAKSAYVFVPMINQKLR